MRQLLILVMLLVLPVAALIRLSKWMDWRVIASVAAGISLLAFYLIRSDKRRAARGEWRISESVLHITELFGGWPGSFLAQRQVRHKTSKARYQLVFWLIVLLFQLLALHFLFDFRFITGLWE